MFCCNIAEDEKLLQNEEIDLSKRSVLLVPGMCSNALEVGGGKGSKHHVAYINIKKIVQEGPKLFHDLELKPVDGRLKNGEAVKTVAPKTDGISVRPVQGLEGCAFLDPHEAVPLIKLWAPLIRSFKSKYNLSVLNYDWRKWGDPVHAEEILENFRELLERETGPYGIIAHSMGAQVVLWCLAQLGEEWTKKHVTKLIFCGPAIAGTPVMFPCYANGPNGNAVEGMFLKYPMEHLDEKLRSITSSFPCMMAEMPTNIGKVQAYPDDQVFATTPTKEYTVKNIDHFFSHASKWGTEQSHWQVAKELWAGWQKMVGTIGPPAVPMHIIYSKSCKTLSQVRYTSEDLMKQPKLEKYEGGDATVSGAPLEALARGWTELGSQVQLHLTPEADKVNHEGCIQCKFTLELLPRLLETDGLLP